MVSIKPKTTFINILEGGFSPTAIMTAIQKALFLNLLLCLTLINPAVHIWHTNSNN